MFDITGFYFIGFPLILLYGPLMTRFTASTLRMEKMTPIDKKTLERLVAFSDFIYKCPRAGEDWIQAFVNYCSSGKTEWKKCEQCIERCFTAHQEMRVEK